MPLLNEGMLNKGDRIKIEDETGTTPVKKSGELGIHYSHVVFMKCKKAFCIYYIAVNMK